MENSLDMPVNPADIKAKMDTPEGEVFKIELERYGEMIAEKEYELRKLKCYDLHKRLRFQEFLGTPLNEEQKGQVEQLEEWIAVWESNNGKDN